jgi:hypothetical protein
VDYRLKRGATAIRQSIKTPPSQFADHSMLDVIGVVKDESIASDVLDEQLLNACSGSARHASFPAHPWAGTPAGVWMKQQDRNTRNGWKRLA